MANTYTLIASNTLSSNAASVTFSSIPGTYTDLVLKTSIRASSTNNGLQIEFNGNTSAIYSYRDIRGDGSTATSLSGNGDTIIFVRGGINSSGYTSNTFANSEIYIPSYTANQNKPLSVFAVPENNATTAEYINATAGLFRSTAAISSIKLFQGGTQNFVTGSSFFLYGIKNS